MAAYTNAKQVIPPLFKAIIGTQGDMAALKAQPVVDFTQFKCLRDEMQAFRRAAEKALSWNVDKGNAK